MEVQLNNSTTNTNSNISSKTINNTINTLNNNTVIKKQKIWSKDEDNLLLSLTDHYKGSKIIWKEISVYFKEKTIRQCYARYRQINPNHNKGPWTPKEDQELMYFYKKYGKRWALLAKLMKTRNSKQIRDRYLNCLDDKLCKKSFTDADDQKITKLIYVFGSNWSRIAKEFEGRTGDNIKNRYYWSIRHSLDKPIDFAKISI